MQRSAAVVAVVFGVVTLVAGSRVLAGRSPGFVVFLPLLVFNVFMGAAYVFAGLRTWQDVRRGRRWAAAIALVNLLVLVTIAGGYLTGFGVAAESLGAMLLRTGVWVGLFLGLSPAARRADASEARTAAQDAADDTWVIRPADDGPATVSAFYAADHDDIDRLFDRFRDAKTGDRTGALLLYRAFKARLVRHIGWEDDILFPLYEELSGQTDNGPTAVMRSEHRELIGRLDSIDTTLEQGEASTNADESALLEALARHNWKEENILYPLIDRQVSRTDRAAIFARMRAEAGDTVPNWDGPANPC